MRVRPVIWLFKEAETDDRFEELFHAAGYEPLFVPVLRTQFLDPPDEIPPVDAVAVTSARAVEAIASWQRLPDLKKLTWFAIGPATRTALDELGITISQESPGTATSLAETIIDAGAKRVLFLAGDPHRDTLKRLLRRNNITVETRIVYRTVQRSLTLPEVGADPDWAVFFSPRGVSIVAEETTIDWESIATAAIGPVTAEAIRSAGWEPDAIAESPTPEALFKAMQTADLDIH